MWIWGDVFSAGIEPGTLRITKFLKCHALHHWAMVTDESPQILGTLSTVIFQKYCDFDETKKVTMKVTTIATITIVIKMKCLFNECIFSESPPTGPAQFRSLSVLLWRVCMCLCMCWSQLWDSKMSRPSALWSVHRPISSRLPLPPCPLSPPLPICLMYSRSFMSEKAYTQ